MRSEDEIRKMQDRFYQDLEIDQDDEELNAIIDTFKWILGQSDELLGHLSD